MTRVLVVAAHPDDEVLGCGGTLARLAAEGHEVVACILGEGATSRFARRADADVQLIGALETQSAEAAKILGAQPPILHGLPDNRFDTVALLDIVKTVEATIDDVGPSVVFVQHGGDLNIDHQVTYRATLAATRPMEGHPVRELYAFEVASSTEWAFQSFSPVFTPSYFVDISATLQAKLDAISAYDGEVRSAPHPRSHASLDAQARRWGSVVGTAAAEAFQPVRVIR